MATIGRMLATDLLTHGITAAVTTLVLAALAPLALRAPKRIGDTTELRLPKAMRIVAWLGIAFFSSLLIGLVVMLQIDPDDQKLVRTAHIGVPLFTLLAMGALGELRVRLAFDAEGIGGQTAFRGKRRVAWRDIVDVRWSNAGYWLRLEDRHGTVLRVSAWLQGHHLVVDMLREHVQKQAWEQAVRGWSKRAKL